MGLYNWCVLLHKHLPRVVTVSCIWALSMCTTVQGSTLKGEREPTLLTETIYRVFNTIVNSYDGFNLLDYLRRISKLYQ